MIGHLEMAKLILSIAEYDYSEFAKMYTARNNKGSIAFMLGKKFLMNAIKTKSLI